MGTLLDQAAANNAHFSRLIADVKAAIPGVQVALRKSLMAIPGAPEAFARDAVLAAQQGRGTVTLATIDLANAGLDISERIAAKEKLIKTGRVRP